MRTDDSDYELLKSSVVHMEDYMDLINLACRNSVDFDSYKTAWEFNEKDKGLC